jgi:hypothetical protein
MKYLFTLSTLLCLPALLAFVERPQNAKDYYTSGLEKMKKEQYIEAIGDFTAAISLEEFFADAYFQRALAKQFFARQAAYVSNEYCSDLIQALRLGKQEAAALISRSCMGECLDLNYVAEPENTYCVYLRNKKLPTLPALLPGLENLVSLDAAENQIVSIEDTKALEGCMHVDLSHNQLTTWPKFQAAQLEELNLSHNQLTDLSLTGYKQLKALYLSHNRLSKLPALQSLKQLQHLDVSYNKLQKLPAELGQLSELRFLRLTGNPLSDEQKALILAKLPHCKVVFDE